MLCQALGATSERIEDILQLGVPIPEHIPFDTFGNVHVDTRKYDIYGRKKLQQYGIDKEACSLCCWCHTAMLPCSGLVRSHLSSHCAAEAGASRARGGG